MPNHNDDRVFILRCHPAVTLEKAAELNTLGFPAYAPKMWVHKRKPRSPAKEWVCVPILPSFIFVDVGDAQELIMTEELHWLKLAKDGLGAPLTTLKKDLKGVRALELKARQRGFFEGFAVGDKVKAMETAFGEFEGTVKGEEDSMGRYLVELEEGFEVWAHKSMLTAVV